MKKRKKPKPQIVICDECFAVFMRRHKCPMCDAVYVEGKT